MLENQKKIILNTDGLTESFDPPQNYGDSPSGGKKAQIVIRPYQEIDTKPSWNTDPKVMGAALSAAVDAQNVHTEESESLKVQCADKLCDLGN